MSVFAEFIGSATKEAEAINLSKITYVRPYQGHALVNVISGDYYAVDCDYSQAKSRLIAVGAKFVEVVDEDTGQPHFVNFDNAEAVLQRGSKSIVVFGGGSTIDVDSDYADLKKLVSGHGCQIL